MKAIFVFLISQTTNPAPRTTASPVGLVVSPRGKELEYRREARPAIELCVRLIVLCHRVIVENDILTDNTQTSTALHECPFVARIGIEWNDDQRLAAIWAPVDQPICERDVLIVVGAAEPDELGNAARSGIEPLHDFGAVLRGTDLVDAFHVDAEKLVHPRSLLAVADCVGTETGTQAVSVWIHEIMEIRQRCRTRSRGYACWSCPPVM